jgi:hypothetical protein
METRSTSIARRCDPTARIPRAEAAERSEAKKQIQVSCGNAVITDQTSAISEATRQASAIAR